MSAKIRNLKAKKAETLKAAAAITDLAAAADRDLTAEEQAAFDKHAADIRSLNAQIENAEFLAAESAGMNLAGGVEVGAAARIEVTENLSADTKHGFKSFGEYAASVRAASAGGRAIDQRLKIGAAAPGTFGGEASGVDGGFLVPPEYSRNIFNLALAEDSLLPM